MANVTQLRLLLDDLDTENELLTDAQYLTIGEIEGNLYRAAALGARAISAKFAERVKITAGPVSIENQQKFDHYTTLAEDYDFRAQEGGGSGGTNEDGSPISSFATPEVTGVSVGEIRAEREDTDRYRESFYRGRDRNPNESSNEHDFYEEYTY